MQDRLAAFVPEAERAAVASQLFGDRAALVFTRIDTATLRQATQDVRDFGVVVSDQDAARIERTNDALSRLGLIWRGLSNQLAVAAAPALEAVANATAAVARTTGPLGIAIRALFDNLGRLTTYAATFAGLMAGRWVAGLAAAALSVRGLATALVVLRGAIIRTGIGALIVGAGELVFQFGRLVRGAGGFGEALTLMGDVARAVWNGIGVAVGAFGDRFRAMRADVEAVWLSMLRFLGQRWADFLSRVAPTVNRLSETLGLDIEIDAMGMQAWVSSFDAAILRAERAAAGFRESAGATLGGAFDEARAALAALMAAIAAGAAEPLDRAAAGATHMAEALAAAEAAAGRAGGAAGAAGAVARESATALTATAETAETAVTGWRAAVAALADYAERARDLGGEIGAALVGAFRSAEDAVAGFVRTGRVEVRGLVSSMIADLARLSARRFILGPIANALSGALTAGFGALFGPAPMMAPAPVPRPVLHGGGIAGGAAPLRRVPDAAFLGAPRLHAGGVAGLRPDEVPAILQRGERVLSRAQTRAYDQRRAPAPVAVTIVARDAESFRQSRTQVAADIARAVSLGRRGL